MAPPPSLAEWLQGEESPAGGGTPVVVRMDSTKYSLVEMEPPAVDKSRGKNAKQFTWVLLLRAHRAAGCVASLAAGALAVVRAVNKRLRNDADSDADADAAGSKAVRGRAMFLFLRAFLLFSLATLAVELLAFSKGWHFHKPALHLPEPKQIEGWTHSLYLSWLAFRAAYIARPIRILSNLCVALFVVQSVDRVILCVGCLYIKLNKIKPEAAADDDHLSSEEAGDEHPMVLVQIPMCNEREVYEQSIAAACQLEWPPERLLIQVLDDSSDELCQSLIRAAVEEWRSHGVNIVYRHRVARTGYKAGNLKSAMRCDYVKDYEFVAIFDADFQPPPEFLKLTVPHFRGKPDVGLVQARWRFVNDSENLLTRLQNINLCFHFEVEQQVNAVFLGFFGFNGTAGVWRIKALEDSGGWMERTTVEDMDIAVRAHLHGWKFVFLNDVRATCELPESFEAYRKQQHRWHSGPMHLFRLCLPAIFGSKISGWKKANLVLLFFLLRKLVLPFYSFTLFCIILPLTMFVPEAELPLWVICYLPVFMSILNILPAPKSFPFIIPYLLFENTMSVTKFNAMVSGLFQLGSSYEWVVTKKAGRASEADLVALAEMDMKPANPPNLQRRVSDTGLLELTKLKLERELPPAAPVKKKANKIYKKELALAMLLLTAAARSLLSAQGIHFYFLLFQGVTFLVVGLDLIGEQVK